MNKSLTSNSLLPLREGVAFVENGNKLAVVSRRVYKPRLALFALLKMLAPDYDSLDLFYRKSLKEFLAACGVRGPSRDTQAQDGEFRKGASEGPRRIIFDLAAPHPGTDPSGSWSHV